MAKKSEVLIENSPLPNNILEDVENSNITEPHKAIIDQYQGGLSQREILETKRDGLKTVRMNKYNDLVHKYFQNDTHTNYLIDYIF